jgi:hypothetical protein
LAYIPPQGLKKSWYGVTPPQGKKFKIPIVPAPPPPPPVEVEPLGEFLVYPFAQSDVLTQDPTYGYTQEYAISSTDYSEIAYWEINKTVDILSVFVNLVCALKSGDGNPVYAKWQIKSGLHDQPGTYIDITNEMSETSTSFNDHSRSGVVSNITGFPTTCPITLRLVTKKTTGASDGSVKIKSNTYIRISYKV